MSNCFLMSQKIKAYEFLMACCVLLLMMNRKLIAQEDNAFGSSAVRLKPK